MGSGEGCSPLPESLPWHHLPLPRRVQHERGSERRTAGKGSGSWASTLAEKVDSRALRMTSDSCRLRCSHKPPRCMREWYLHRQGLCASFCTSTLAARGRGRQGLPALERRVAGALRTTRSFATLSGTSHAGNTARTLCPGARHWYCRVQSPRRRPAPNQRGASGLSATPRRETPAKRQWDLLEKRDPNSAGEASPSQTGLSGWSAFRAPH